MKIIETIVAPVDVLDSKKQNQLMGGTSDTSEISCSDGEIKCKDGDDKSKTLKPSVW